MKVGIIGAGNIAEHHLQVLKDLDVEIAAICSRGDSKKEKAEKFNIPNQYSDYKKMFENKLDAVFNLSSPENIAKITLDCLDYGIPVFTEKPAALYLEEAEKIAKKAKEKNVPVMVGCNRRFVSTIQKAKELAKKLKAIHIEIPERITYVKGLGKSEQVVNRWIYANSIHCIDLFRYFAGDVKSVSAKKNNNIYSANIDFSNNVFGNLFSVWDSASGWKVILYTDDNILSLSPLEKLNVGNKIFELDEIDKKYKPGFYKQDSYFLECVKQGKDFEFPASNIHDSVNTMKLIKEINGS